MITQKRLKELLEYDGTTGIFTRKKRFGKHPAGERVGFLHSLGYISICVDGHRVLAHRLAWLYVNGEFPSEKIRHINGDITDNRTDNLELITHDGREMTQEYIKSILHYNPETGEFVRLENRGGQCVGDVAGLDRGDGYIRIIINDRKYYAHRLAWLYITGSWPSDEIDHINHDPSDNRIANLRVVSRGRNMRNASRRKDNKSGHTDVRWYEKCGKWHAEIRRDRKKYHLGLFENIEDAIAARKAAEKEFGFHPNHGK